MNLSDTATHVLSVIRRAQGVTSRQLTAHHVGEARERRDACKELLEARLVYTKPAPTKKAQKRSGNRWFPTDNGDTQ